MKKLVIILFIALSFGSCKRDLSLNDYSLLGPSSSIFFDNNGGQCFEGGIAIENTIKGAYKVIDGEIYTFYVIPERKVYPYYALWQKARYYQSYVTETGWVKLSDIQDNNLVSHVRYAHSYIRHL